MPESLRTFSRLVLCMSFAAAICMRAAPLGSDYIWQTWTREHGLPMGQIQTILQTRDGYLWVGTSAGIARFDGRQWQLFNRANTPQLVADDCSSLVEDVEGNLWAECKGFLFRWNGNAFEKCPWPDGRENRSILKMCASRSGGLWVIAEPGLWLLRAGQDRIFRLVEATKQASLMEIGVISLNETEEGLWIGCSRGLTRFDPKTERFVHDHNLAASELPQSVMAVESDDDGVQHVLHVRGNRPNGWLSPFDNGAWRSNSAAIVENGGRRVFLYRDRSGTFWFPNARGLISRLDKAVRSNVRLPSIAAQDWVIAMGDDREGGLWLGTEGNRLLRLQPKKVRSLTNRDSLPHQAVWTIFETRDGTIWIGSDGGVSRVRGENFTNYTKREGLSRNAVRAIAEDADGRIWIGTGSGLDWIMQDQLRQYRFPGEWFNTKIRVILPGRDRTLWIGTAQGLHCLRLASDHHLHALPFTTVGSYNSTNGLPHDDVRALIEDRAGTLWVGTLGGLYRFKRGELKLWTLANRSVWALHEDAEGALWAGTQHGLARFKDNRLITFNGKDILSDDSVNHILEDDCGQLWLGGERGIYRVKKRELDDFADGRASTVRFIAYDEDEGLVSRETNGQKNQPGAIKSRDGRLWFSTTKGAVIFDPTRLPDQTLPPPVVIEQIHASGETISCRREFALRAGSGRIVEIHYTANTFVAPDKVRFKYRLDGLDKDWTDAGTRRVAQYANLRPGKYRFQVLAVNKYGVWNETGASFAFTLAPFFWQTPWFKAAVLIVPLLAAWGYYHQRMVQHRRHAESERRLAISTERADIARDLHDHLGARLTLVQHLTQALDHSPSENGHGALPRQRLVELARELNASLDSAVWAVQPDKDTLASLADYLGDTFQELLGGTHIELELDYPEPLPSWPLSRAERYHLALIAVEALNNVLKHAHATVVRLRLEITGNRFTFRIHDNGRGFIHHDSANGHGNGFSNMRQRMHRLGGHFELTTALAKGTTAAITLVPCALRKTMP